MKSKLTLSCILLLVALGLFSCEKNNLEGVPSDTPICVQSIIEKKQKAAVENPPASVWQYQYKGQTVYYFPPPCCDFNSELIDANCNHLCSPDGGFSGMGDGQCPDFFRERTNERLIWKDKR
jgi:hypothetical protein